MNRNDSPRTFNKVYDIIREIFNNKVQIDKFSPEFIEALNYEEESYVNNS
jgi:hypothetical protein